MSDIQPGEEVLGGPSGNLLVGLRPEPAAQSRPSGDHQAHGDLFGTSEPEFISAISMWQPWASLVFVTEPAWQKRHETRGRPYPTKYHGQRVAFQAAAKFPDRRHISPELHSLCVAAFGADYRRTLPLGAFLGTAILAACYPTEHLIAHIGHADLVAGIWDEGRYGWQLDAPQALPSPIPAKGKQGWWKVLASDLACRPIKQREGV